MRNDSILEELISLSDVPSLLPCRRGGKKPHVATIYRWASRGIRGVFLETVQIGGTRCTSRAALARFFDRLGDARTSRGDVEPNIASPRRVRVDADLDEVGL